MVADIGGDLNIESLQDSSHFDSKQSSSGLNASLCIPPFCYGASTVGGSISKSKVNGEFLSVLEQSGIKAGDGGFQVTVAGNTDLKGGLLSSSQVAIDEGNNILMTGSLTASDLQNKDEFSASGFSMSGSVSGTFGNQTLPPGKTLTEEQQKAADAGGKPTASAGIGSASGSQTSTTFSGISGGLVIITDQKKQDATGKSADAVLATIDQTVTTESAAANATALIKGWDGQQLQKELDAQVAITKEFSKQAPQAIAKYAGKKFDELKSQAQKQTDTAKKEELLAEAAKWDEGGSYRVALHAVSGALSGGLGGAVGGAAVASSAQLLNELQVKAVAALVGQGLSPETAKAMAQGIAEVTALGVGALAGGTSGAASALASDTNNRQLHLDDKKNAAMLSAVSGGKYTKAQIEDAMRAGGNTKFGETVTSGLVVPLNAETKADQLYDTKGMILTNDGEGHVAMVQQVQQRVDPALAAFIQANTGGRNSPYTWDDATLGRFADSKSTPSASAITPNANGCVTAECAAGVLPNVTDKAGETRFFGVVQAVGGGVQSVGGGTLVGIGLASCPETLGLGCAVAAFGGFQMLAGWDNVYTGARNLDGTPHATIGGTWLQQTGLSPGQSELLYGGLQLGGAYTGGLMVGRLTPGTTAVAVTTADSTGAVNTVLVDAGAVRTVNVSGSTQNCTNCVVVVDNLLTTGNPASALPRDVPVPFNQLGELYGTKFSGWTSQKNIESSLLSSGNGTRAVIYGTDGVNAHVWNAVVQNGKVNYIDGQIGGSGAVNFNTFTNFQFGVLP